MTNYALGGTSWAINGAQWDQFFNMMYDSLPVAGAFLSRDF